MLSIQHHICYQIVFLSCTFSVLAFNCEKSIDDDERLQNLISWLETGSFSSLIQSFGSQSLSPATFAVELTPYFHVLWGNHPSCLQLHCIAFSWKATNYSRVSGEQWEKEAKLGAHHNTRKMEDLICMIEQFLNCKYSKMILLSTGMKISTYGTSKHRLFM